MATTHSFGHVIQPNGERKALASLNIQNTTNNCFQSLKQQQLTLHHYQQQKSSFLEDQENICFKQKTSFTIYKDDIISTLHEGKDQEDILQENIEAVKKELNSFLIDSIEKSFSDISKEIGDQKNSDASFMNVDVDIADDNNDYDDVDQKENCLHEESQSSQHSEISYVQNYTDFDLLSDYSESIWLYMLEKERQFMPNPFYMSKQQHINTKMRSILVDWLVDVADEYKLKDETLFLTINYIDRFLSKYSISRQEFQLLGTSALFIASKYEEIYPPVLADFVYITDDSFSKTQILVMEKTILNGLSFDVSVPTSNYFLELFSSELVLDKQVYCLAKYLTFLSTLECTPFLKYYPSEIALCSIVLASKIFRINDQISDDFIQNSLLYEKRLGPQGDVLHLLNERNNLMEALNQLRIYASKHPQQAIQKKYCDNKYYNVSKIADEATI